MANGEMRQDPGQGQSQQGGGQGGGGSLPTDVLQGMQAVGQALQRAGAPQEVMQMMQQAIQLYTQVLQAAAQGGGQQQGNEPQPRPVNTQGTVAGPQG